MRALLLLLLLLAPIAHADQQKGIDLADLPPLPQNLVTEGDTDDTSSSIAVLAATQASEDVVVGAAKREQSLGNVASAVTVVSGDRIRRFGYRSVSEALRSVAGLYVVDDRMSERLGIRGLQLLGDFNTRILVLIDGATLNEPWNQFVGIGEDLPVAIDDIERIEVVRGPVSSVYGTNAFFGIINIVTKGADRQARAYGRVSAGIFGTFSGTAGFSAGSVNRQVRGTFHYLTRSGETVNIPAIGDVSNDGVEGLNGSLVAHYDGAFAQVRAYHKVRELTGAPFSVNPDDRRNHNVDEMIMAEGGYAKDIGDTTLTARAYINRYEFQDFLVPETPGPNFLDFGDSFWFGGELRAHVKVLPKEQLGFTAGVEVARDSVESQSYEEGNQAGGTDIPTSFTVLGVYGEAESVPVPWLGLSAGLRYDVTSDFQGDGMKLGDGHDHLSLRAALLLHQKDDYGLKLLFAQGFRIPSPFEAFFDDQMSQIANPDLRPETITSYEAVVWSRPLPGLNLRLSGFRWELGDMLQSVTVDTVNNISQFQNVNEIISQGVELEASYRDTSGWYGFLSATVVSVDVIAPDGSSDAALNAPSLVAALGVSTPKLWDLVHVSAELQLISSRRTRDPMTTAEAHAGINLALVIPAWHKWDFTLGVRNLLGTREQIPAQVDYDRISQNVYLLPGEAMELYARVGYSY